MRNREIITTCFRFRVPYNLSPVVVPGYWLMLRQEAQVRNKSLLLFDDVRPYFCDLADFSWCDCLNVLFLPIFVVVPIFIRLFDVSNRAQSVYTLPILQRPAVARKGLDRLYSKKIICAHQPSSF